MKCPICNNELEILGKVQALIYSTTCCFCNSCDQHIDYMRVLWYKPYYTIEKE